MNTKNQLLVALSILIEGALSNSSIVAKLPPSRSKTATAIQIGPAVSAKAPDDPTTVRAVGAFRGLLAHTYFLKQKPYTSALITSVNLGVQSDILGREQITQPDALVTYPLRKPNTQGYQDQVLVDPVFSPDGRFLLFKRGEMTIFPSWRLYVLDTQTKQVQQVAHTPMLNYPIVSWSPDSRYLAYILAGDNTGNPHDPLGTYEGPLSLRICDWRVGKEYIVVENDTVRGPFGWSAPHTLVYGFLAQDKKVALEAEWRRQQDQQLSRKEPTRVVASRTASSTPAPQPDVFEYSVERKSSSLLFHDGYRPVVSPDKKWVAFFGSEQPRKSFPLRPGWEDSPKGSSLSVARRDGTGRVALSLDSSYSSVIWEQDSRYFLSVQQVGAGRAEIKRWDIQNHRFNVVATLQAIDKGDSYSTPTDPQFLPLRLSRDGRTLFLRVTESAGLDPSGNWYLLNHSIQAVDLPTGAVTTVVQVTNSSGADWYELPS